MGLVAGLITCKGLQLKAFKSMLMGNSCWKIDETLEIPFANSPYPMWIYDLRTLAFLKVNDAAVMAYGFSEEEFLKMTVLDIRPSRDVQKFLHSWKQQHQSTAERWWHIGKRGVPFRVSITSWEITYHGDKAELVLARRASESE